MKAITVEPMKPGSARYDDFPEPDEREGSILVEAVAVGVCGTDVDIVSGNYGWAPPGKTRLVLGHESLGRVIDPGPSSSLKKGDLVVGIVRRPCPVPCPNCAVGEWDMCSSGQYTERGIKEIHGYMSERWRIEPEYAIKVDPSMGILGVLLEPTTVITRSPRRRAHAEPQWCAALHLHLGRDREVCPHGLQALEKRRDVGPPSSVRADGASRLLRRRRRAHAPSG